MNKTDFKPFVTRFIYECGANVFITSCKCGYRSNRKKIEFY